MAAASGVPIQPVAPARQMRIFIRSAIGLVNASQYSSTQLVVKLFNGATATQIGSDFVQDLGPLGQVQPSIANMFPSFTGGMCRAASAAKRCSSAAAIAKLPTAITPTFRSRASAEHVVAAVNAGRHVVVGSSGLSDADYAELVQLLAQHAMRLLLERALRELRALKSESGPWIRPPMTVAVRLPEQQRRYGARYHPAVLEARRHSPGR